MSNELRLVSIGMPTKLNSNVLEQAAQGIEETLSAFIRLSANLKNASLLNDQSQATMISASDSSPELRNTQGMRP